MQQMMVLSAAQRNQGGNQSQKNAAPMKIGIHGGYKIRKIQRDASYKISFNRMMPGEITTPMATNIGNLQKRYGNNDKVFRTVVLDGQAEVYRRREVVVAVDGLTDEDFTKYINSVSFTMRKIHGSGKQTIREVVITRGKHVAGEQLVVDYPWLDDPNVDAWQKFDFDVVWNFQGGAKHIVSDTQSDPVVILVPPYQYRRVEFEADEDILPSDVRRVTIRTKHKFFGKEVRETINLRPRKGIYTDTREFAVPPGNDTLDYQITWEFTDGRRQVSEWLNSTDNIVSCDILPST